MKEVLEKLGLSNDEVKVYLFLLKKASSKVTEISKELNIARSSIYRFLEMLQNKGFVTHNIQNGTQIYYPLEPQKVLELISTTKEEFKEIIPDLEKIRSFNDDKTKVEVFKGLAGVRIVMMDIINEKKDYIGIGEGEIYSKELRLFGISWVRQVNELKLNGRILGSEKLLDEVPIAKTEKYRQIPKDLIPETAVYVYGNKTAQFIWSENPHTILIENEDIANSHRKYFDYLWNNVAKEIKKSN